MKFKLHPIVEELISKRAEMDFEDLPQHLRKFLKNKKCDEFWYDLTSGGYVKPETFLADDQQIKELKKAIELVEAFEKVVTAAIGEG